MVHLGEALRSSSPRGSPDAPQVHLQDGRAADAQQAREIVLGGEALAGGDGDAGGARHARHLLGRIRRHRLLEPQGIVALEARARRIAPAAVICPWVPNSRSACEPTASRSWRMKRSHRSSAASDSCRPSKAV